MSRPRRWATLLQRSKDAATSLVLRRGLEGTIQRYGRMLDLKIDSERKAIELHLLPKGETEPIRITLEPYELVTEGNQTFVLVHKASASREWLAVVLNDFVCGRRFPVPAKYASAFRLLG